MKGKSGIFVLLAAFSHVAAGIVTQPIDGGGTALIVDGAAYTADETAALNGNTVEELWKTGTVSLVSSGIGSFSGIIRVKGGILQVADQAGLGTTAGATYVENGKVVGYLVANPDEKPMTVTLPAGEWEALWGAAGDFTGTLTVEGKTAVLLKVK